MIKSHLLYQLSYAPGTGPESLRKRASFSKATPRCPASRRSIPGSSGGRCKTQKPPESGGFCCVWKNWALARLEPFGTASVAMIPAHPAIAVGAPIAVETMVPIVAIAVAPEFMVPPAAAEPAGHMRQHPEPVRLAVIESLVKRVGGVRDPLQRRGRSPHPIGPRVQPRHRIIRLLRILGFILLRLHPRIGEGRPVLGVHSHMVVKPWTMLGIDHGRTGDGERGDAGEQDFLHANLL